MTDGIDFTPEQIDGYLTHYTHQVEAGRKAEKMRSFMVTIARTAYPDIYTQARLAELTGVSQQAISKTVAGGKRRHDTGPYLLGRVLALALASGESDIGAVESLSTLAAMRIHTDGVLTAKALARLLSFLRKDITAIADRDTALAERFTGSLDQIARLSTGDGEELDVLLAAAFAGGESGTEVPIGDEMTRVAMTEGFYAQRFGLRHSPDGLPFAPGGKVRGVADIAAALRED
ncbi:hypothetical protein [Phytomonospora endophytica]|uniref:Transcriptional regulator with XRE-family HTH domain n=1 Tax=Phytomonospora endophytica TaxID=714109 RepID=A0A841FI90_9ACTN|nr:hypothetical protein [Phytomonospora endophytica]MBB6037061.1 transcriptional regulator with XRE-family HTH domain [Phytomonospora endophytica]GIG69396.1 hypothetical protein Pen01_56910 [Phytomonospora endophytica]